METTEKTMGCFTLLLYVAYHQINMPKNHGLIFIQIVLPEKSVQKQSYMINCVCVCLQDAREFLTYVPHQMRCFAPTAADDSSEVQLLNHTRSYAVVQEVFRSFLSLDYYCSCINVEAGFYCLLRWSCFLTVMFLTNTSNYVSNELISDYFLE